MSAKVVTHFGILLLSTLVGKKTTVYHSASTFSSFSSPLYLYGSKISHRVILTQELSRRFGLENYLDFREEGIMQQRELSDAPRLSITVDSLQHLINLGSSRDLLILDEVTQILRYLTFSKTLSKSRRIVRVAFEALIRNAHKVLVMDADLDKVTYDYLCGLKGKKNIEVVVNDFVPEKNIPLYSFEKKTELLSHMCHILRIGGKIYFACNSKSEVVIQTAIIKAQFPNLRVMSITSDNSNEEAIREFAKNLNENVIDYDILLASPSIGTGCDISVEHFDYTFVIGARRSTNHRDLLQHMSRNRKAKAIFCWIDPTEENHPIDPEYYRKECVERAVDTGLIVGYDVQGRRIPAAIEQRQLKLYGAYKAQDAISHNKLAENFYLQAELEGYQVKECTAEVETLEYSKARTQTKGIIKEKGIQAVLDAPDLEMRDVQKLKRRENGLSRSERVTLERNKIKDFYKETPTKDLLEYDREGKTRISIFNLALLLGYRDSLELDDKDMLNTDRLITDFTGYTLATYRRIEILKQFCVLDDDGYFTFDKEFCAKDLSQAVRWTLKNKLLIRRDLGLYLHRDFPDKPVQFLAEVLQQVGIKLKHRRFGKRGKQVYYYRLDRESFDKALKYAERLQLEAQRDCASSTHTCVVDPYVYIYNNRVDYKRDTA
ncbi:hypothetical protein OZ401_005122 (plasmid) [Candidatus Chlorohelix allophototropha]|nr:hypothetical protein OZ401_005122 [Chloroflexota bacterium L227-S17]